MLPVAVAATRADGAVVLGAAAVVVEHLVGVLDPTEPHCGGGAAGGVGLGVVVRMVA
jgi:hypothetical protein